LLTIGHLDPGAIHDRMAIALKPLDAATVARVLAEFPGLNVERCDGDQTPRSGLQARRERLLALGVLPAVPRGGQVADRRNGRRGAAG